MMTTEEKKDLLKQAWKEVFETKEVADNTDFFEEGGDSIKAVQLSAWLIQKGLRLDLGTIFYTPVLEDMANSLEEADPMYVPDELMTKDMIEEKAAEILKEGQTDVNNVPPEAPGFDPQQICDPNDMPQPQQAPGFDPQQICDPNDMPQPQQAPGFDPQQICDPNDMSQPQQAPGFDPQQICDPNGMPQPQQASGFDPQQICDPNGMPFMPQQQMPWAPAPVPQQQDNTTLLSLIISQQQTILQMIQLLADQTSRPHQPPMAPMTGFSPARTHIPSVPRMPFPGSANPAPRMSAPAPMPPLSEKQKAEMAKFMEEHRSKKIDQPIEKPNVIGLKTVKVGKPTKSAEEVLSYVLSTVLPKGFNKETDLFEQGLSSLDTVKIVTRCGEYGYSVRMQDIYMHSTFNELVTCMKPGK